MAESADMSDDDSDVLYEAAIKNSSITRTSGADTSPVSTADSVSGVNQLNGRPSVLSTELY